MPATNKEKENLVKWEERGRRNNKNRNKQQLTEKKNLRDDEARKKKRNKQIERHMKQENRTS